MLSALVWSKSGRMSRNMTYRPSACEVLHKVALWLPTIILLGIMDRKQAIGSTINLQRVQILAVRPHESFVWSAEAVVMRSSLN